MKQLNKGGIMSSYHLLAYTLAFVIGTSCVEPAPFGAQEQEAIKNEIRLMFSEYYSDVREQGLIAEIKYLDTSADFFWVAPGYPGTLNYDTVIAIVKKNAADYISVDQHWDTLEIHPLSPTLAVYTGRISSEITGNSGLTSKNSLLETGIVIRRENGWKLLSGETTLANENKY